MRKIMLIAAREYKAAVRTKAFLIGLLSMPVMMFGSIAVQTALKDHIDITDKHFAVVDRTPGAKIVPVLQAIAGSRNRTQIFNPETKMQSAPRFVISAVEPSEATPTAMAAQRFALSERVKAKELTGFLEVGADVLNPPPGTLPALDPKGRPLKPPADRVAIRYQTNTPLGNDFPQWAETTINAAVMQQRASARGISLKAIVEALQPAPLVTKKLSKKDPVTGEIGDVDDAGRAASFLVPAGLSIMMLMMIMVGTAPLLQSVFEEKMARIAEVLLGSVSPFELMMGKLIGTVGVSLTTAAIYLTVAYFSAQRYGFAEYLSPSLLAWFVVFQILGVLMFGSLYIAIGAACSDIRETQPLVMPVMLLGMLPMFALVNLIERPSGPLALGLSFFPFSAPIVMVVRQAVPPGIPWWQPALSIVIVLCATVACVYAAGRILRVGLLMQGKGANFAQMARWVFRG
jgi:ABC-2 type transport system permease protein